MNAPTTDSITGWGAARLADASVAQTAALLPEKQLWLPGQAAAITIPMAPLREVGARGHDSQMLVSEAHKGPFTKLPPKLGATYPALWNHKAPNETRLICEPDSQLVVKPGMEERANELWKSAGRAHLNRDFTFSSQALAVAFTERPTLGGRVWPNVNFNERSFDYAFTVWGNSTLGLLMYWWFSSRQQSSKATLTVKMFELLSVLDLRVLNGDQLSIAEATFDEFRDLELQPAYLADADPNRALLDRRVICDLLGFDEDTYRGVRLLAEKWCAEPSVHGGKPRPPNAKLII